MTDIPVPPPADGQPDDIPSDPFGYSEDFGVIRDPTELSEADEDYRAAAFKDVTHYAGDFGIPCFPVWWMATETACACKEGINCQNKAKHPIDEGWPEVATNDPDQAARWWRKLEPGDEITDWRPRANIGLAMGDKHFLLDVDMGPDKSGDISLGALISHYGDDMPHTLLYQTGGGGRQHVMLIPDGTEARNSVSELGDNLDIRGVRGYGIAPPSVSGKGEYVTVIDAAPEYPCEWLVDWLVEQQEKRTRRIEARPKGKGRQPPEKLSTQTRAYIAGALADAVRKIAGTPEHGRNNCLNKEAWSLFTRFGVSGLLDPGDIAMALKDAAEMCGLRGAEIPRTLQSAWAGAENEDRSSELPDFVFQEKVPTPERAPSITSGVYEFERLYTLRRADTGEFISRPNLREMPPLVCDIADELGWRLRQWWRDQAEAWNEHIQKLVAAAAAAEAANPDGKDAKKDGDKAEEYANPCPPDATFSTMLSHLRASAARHKPVEQHLRVMDTPGRVLVDLADEAGHVVVITADGWEIADPRDVDGHPWLKRNPSMRPQVLPARVAPEDVAATLDEARDVLGLDAGQWPVVLAGLIGAYFPSIARPGWWMIGPSGVGKTTRGEQLTGLVDPMGHLGGRINLKRDERNARTKAVNTFVFTLDNASSITQDESDFWCTMHTGASEQVRKLHSDNTMLSFEYRRIGLGTSRTMPSGFQSDALRRMLLIRLKSTDNHPDVEDIKAKYDKVKPRALGALFSVIAGVLEKLGKAMSEELIGVPEMSDYARRLKAADMAFPGLVLATQVGGQVTGLYEAYREHAFEVLVVAGLENPMTLLVLRLMDQQENQGKTTLTKQGKAKLTMLPADLLKEFRKLAGPDIAEKWFPVDATRMGEKLTDMDGPLRRLGIVMDRAPRTSRGIPYVFTRTKASRSGAGDPGSGAGNEVSTT